MSSYAGRAVYGYSFEHTSIIVLARKGKYDQNRFTATAFKRGSRNRFWPRTFTKQNNNIIVLLVRTMIAVRYPVPGVPTMYTMYIIMTMHPGTTSESRIITEKKQTTV